MEKHIVRSIGFVFTTDTFERFDSRMNSTVLSQSMLSSEAFATGHTLELSKGRMGAGHVLP